MTDSGGLLDFVSCESIPADANTPSAFVPLAVIHSPEKFGSLSVPYLSKPLPDQVMANCCQDQVQSKTYAER